MKSNYNNSKTFISTFNPYVICLQETQLGPNTVLNNGQPIAFKNYNMYREDHRPGK